MGKESIENVVVIKSLLRCFEFATGLKVNFFKSRCGAIGVDEIDVRALAGILHCRVLTFPFVHLGIPIKANSKRRSTWRPIVDKYVKKLSS